MELLVACWECHTSIQRTSRFGLAEEQGWV